MNLTIIIPTYNRHSGVVECALALERNRAEIIIVDDGSDQPVALPSNAARVLRHERHRGRAAAINTGLKAALHDLVLILDDDIYAAPDMVLQMVDEFKAHRNPKLALTGRVIWDPDIPLTLTMRWLAQIRKFPAPTLLWRPFVFQHGGYDENFTCSLEQVELQLRLKQQGLASFVKTSGGKGLHVVAPLEPRAEWDAVKPFAKALADDMAADSPDRFVAVVTKAKRQGKILVDYLRNGRGATAVAPYSTRARPGATVSMPLAWEELADGLGPAYFTVGNTVTRLNNLRADPWADFRKAAVPLPAAGGRKRPAK